MPNYTHITSRGRHHVRVLLQDGTTRVLSIEDFENNWTSIEIEPPFEYDFDNYVNPPNPEDRVYIRVLRGARFNTTVSLPNGAVIKIPNEYFSTWTQGRDTSDIPLCGIYARTERARNTRNNVQESQTNNEQPRRRRGRPRRSESLQEQPSLFNEDSPTPCEEQPRRRRGRPRRSNIVDAPVFMDVPTIENNSDVIEETNNDSIEDVIENLTDDICSQSDIDGNAESVNTVRRRGRPRSTEPRGFQNPENQADRLYVSIVRNGGRNTSVLRPNGEQISVPNELLDTWLRVGTTAYLLWQEQVNYPNGRSIDDLTFGVEIEFIADRDKLDDFCSSMQSLVGIDRYICPMRYHHSSTTQWSLGTDNSVQPTTTRTMHKSGYELTSPILKFNSECRQELRDVLRLITSVFNGEINKTCGTHIHIGNFANRLTGDFRSKVQQFRLFYGDMESVVFDRVVSPSRRLNANRYCLSNYNCNEDTSRYMKINTQKLDIFGTLENRQHQGTLEINKIWNWMELNGKFMVSFFNDPSKFTDSFMSMDTFFDLIGLSEEAKAYFIERERYFRERNS